MPPNPLVPPYVGVDPPSYQVKKSKQVAKNNVDDKDPESETIDAKRTISRYEKLFRGIYG